MDVMEKYDDGRYFCNLVSGEFDIVLTFKHIVSAASRKIQMCKVMRVIFVERPGEPS